MEQAGKDKTYRAKLHDVTRNKQKENSDEINHPSYKEKQIRNLLQGKSNLSILELFSGRGCMTKILSDYGNVECHDKKYLKTGDSYLVFHKYISERKNYDVVDLDPYGFPTRFFPDIFLLITDGVMFITMPKPFVNILNGITKQHLICYFGESNPSLEVIKSKIKLFGLCHWREVTFVSVLDIGKMWRIGCIVKKVKATDYTGVRNRAEEGMATELFQQTSLF